MPSHPCEDSRGRFHSGAAAKKRSLFFISSLQGVVFPQFRTAHALVQGEQPESAVPYAVTGVSGQKWAAHCHLSLLRWFQLQPLLCPRNSREEQVTPAVSRSAVSSAERTRQAVLGAQSNEPNNALKIQ